MAMAVRKVQQIESFSSARDKASHRRAMGFIDLAVQSLTSRRRARLWAMSRDKGKVSSDTLPPWLGGLCTVEGAMTYVTVARVSQRLY